MSKTQSTKMVRSFHEEILPFCLPIAYPMPSIWLSSMNSLNEVPNDSKVIVRDGLTPLLWFLNSSLKDVKTKMNRTSTKFYVHEDVWREIPTEWRNNFGAFRLVPLNAKSPQTASRLVLFGCPDPTYATLHQIEKLTMKLAHVCRHKNIQEKFMFLPQQSWRSEDHPENYEFEFYKILFRNLGTDLYILRHQDAWTPSLYSNCLTVDLNQGLLVGANAFLDYALSQGARPAFGTPLRENEKIYACSSVHGVVLSEKPTEKISEKPTERRTQRYTKKYTDKFSKNPSAKPFQKNKGNRTNVGAPKMSGLYNEDLLCKAIKLSQKESTNSEKLNGPFRWPSSFASCISDWVDQRS